MARLYAPSRLHKTTLTDQQQNIGRVEPTTSSTRHQKSTWQISTKFKQRVRKYLHYSICLVIALAGYYGSYQLMQRVYPNQIQHFLWKNSYLPFTTLIFISNFFFFTFLTLNKKWGLFLSSSIALILYWRLNQIEFDLPALAIIPTSSAILFFLIFQNLQDIMPKHHGKK